MKEREETMKYRDPKILLRIAMADAYAAAVEYVPRTAETNELYTNTLAFRGYQIHPTHLGLGKLYTDDTEMSIANTHVLLEHGVGAERIDFANAYVQEFAFGGRRKGYSRAFQELLERTRNGHQLLATLRPDSSKNGAAMRAVPFGVIPSITQLLEVATRQARITHDTPEGRFSARLVALMAHFSLYEDAPLSLMSVFCKKYLPTEDRAFAHVFKERWGNRPVKKGTYSVGVNTVHAVLELVATSSSLMEILRRTIEIGGDTDSVAAIAWGVASPRYPDEALPEFFERDLENGNPRTGAPRLLALGEQLMQKFA